MFANTDKAHDYAGKVYKAMVYGTWLSIALYSFFPASYKDLLLIWYLDFEWLRIVGCGLVVISFIWIVIAQFQMGNSWRIGVDYNDETTLVNKGLFSFSRNPIFLEFCCHT